MKLNLGCDSDLFKDHLNVDIEKPERSKSNEPVDNFNFYKSTVDNLSWLKDESISEIRAKDIIDHIYLIDLPYLKKLLNFCGFKIEKFWYEKTELNLDCIKIN